MRTQSNTCRPVRGARDTAPNMSDFPSSESPHIPWKDAVHRVPLGSTAAPGPPTVSTTNKPIKPKRRQMAASLGNNSSPAAAASNDHSTHNGNDVGVWDPMASDYNSTEFNAYNSGVGALMQSGRSVRDEGGDITLFVSTIPRTLTKDGFRELFSRAGVVKRANIIKPTQANKLTTYGFVDFATIKEADAAIQKLNNFDMGNGIKLGVKVSERKEHREKRLAKMKEDEEFLCTLNCGKYTIDEEHSSFANGYELTSQEMKQSEKNPFFPSYRNKSPMADSPQEPCGTEEEVEHEEKGAEGFSLGDSAGALSLHASTMNSQTSPTGNGKSLPAIRSPSSPSQPGLCVKCKRPCKTKCSRCKAPYCSKKCQVSDWPSHMLDCKGDGRRASSNTDQREELVIREKEQSEDEGFEILTPPLSELMSVLQRESVLQKQSTISEAVKILSMESPGMEPLPEQTVDSSTPESPAVPFADKESPSSPVGDTAAVNLPQTPPITPSQSPDPKPDNVVLVSLPQAPPPSHGFCLSLTKVLEVFQTSSFPLPSIPLGSSLPQRFTAIVTSAISCVRFNVILMSVESKQALKTIRNCGLTTYLAPVEPLCLVVGSKIGYLDKDRDLYRMEVTAIGPNIQLRYYDFGGYYKSSAHDKLVTLPEDIVTIPCLRYRCALNSLRAKDYEGIDYLMNVIGGNPVKITNLGRHQTLTSQSIFYNCGAHLLNGIHINQLVFNFLKQHPQAALQLTPRPGQVPLLDHPITMPPSSPLTPSGPPSLPPDSSSVSNPGYQQPPTQQSGGQYKLMHMAKDLKVHVPPLNEEFVIIPKVVDSPSSIWAHVKHSRLSNLQRMHKDINQQYSSSKAGVYSPSVGEVCVVRYCQDKQFYRAEVLCVNNNGTVDVRFVDFGNREMILVSQVQHIQPIYLTLPIQAVHFSLAGVVPCGQALSWGDSAVTYLKDKFLNRELTAKVVEQKGNTFIISLSDPDNPRRSIADAMVAMGCCEKPSSKRSDSSLGKMMGVKMMQSPSSPVDTRNCSGTTRPTLLQSPDSDTHFGESSGRGFKSSPKSPSLSPTTPPCDQGRGAVQSPRKFKQDSKSSPSPGTRAPKILQIPQISLTSAADYTVVVSHVVSPAVFHVQKLDKVALTSLNELSQRLNGTTLNPLLDPKQNAFCAAKYADDEALYRSRIYSRSGSKYTVKFVDYGNIEEVSLDDMYVLPPDFATLPAQGILCTLRNFRPKGKREQGEKQAQPSPASIQDFKRLVEDKVITLHVNMVIDSNPQLYPKHVVDITVEDGEDVLGALVQAGHCVSLSKPSGGKEGGGKRGKFGEGGFRGGEGGSGKGTSGGRNGGFKQKIKLKQNESTASLVWDVKESNDGQQWSPSTTKSNRDSSTDEVPGASPSPVKTQDQLLQSDQSIMEQLPSSASFPPLSSLPATQLPSDQEYVEVVVTDVSCPPVFSVQLATEQSLGSVSNIQTGLNTCTYPPVSSSSTPPPLGHVCCCKYPLDDMWYRAAVIEVQGTKCVVQFIDYGNKETVSLSNIVPCPPQFLQEPIMSIQCSLIGVAPPPHFSQWSQQTISFLQQKCCDRVLLAKVEYRDEKSGMPHIQLIDTSSDDDTYISGELIRAGLAVAPSPVNTPTASPAEIPLEVTPAVLPERGPTYTPVTHLPGPIFPDNEEFDVLVTSVASFTELYIHPVTSDTAHNMNTFMDSITEYCQAQTTLPDAPPFVGHYCLAKFSDGNWFRAKVEAVNSRGVDVLFVDFGNCETVALAQIRPMAAQFADLPIQVLQCGLCGIEPEKAVNPDLAACHLLGEVTSSSKMICSVVCCSPLLVDLTVPATGKSVKDELVTAGKLSPVPHDAIFSVSTSSLTLDTKVNVLVTDVQGPGNFCVQSLESPNLAQLPPLMHRIGTYCCSPQHSAPPRSPVLGELCCAQFSEDSVWYRARVIAFSSVPECRVCFLDYGNCETCAVSAVLPAAQEFLSLPTLAVSCCLVGWEDWEGEGEGGSVQKFKGLTENQSLQATQRGTRRGRAVVELESLKDGLLHKQL